MKRKFSLLLAGIMFLVIAGTTAMIAQSVDPRPAPPPMEGGRRAMTIMRAEGEGPSLGVMVSDVKPDDVRELKLPGEYGVIVNQLSNDSSAAKAGIQKGDVILQFAGEKVRSAAQLARLVRETPPGRAVSVEISRSGRTQNVTATLVNPAPPERMFRYRMPNVEIPQVRLPDFNALYIGGPRLGVSGDDLTSQLADYFGVKQGKGVLVREVEEGTPAQKAGLKAGDVIVRVGSEEITSVAELRRALQGSRDQSRTVNVTVVRDRKEQTLSVQLEAPRSFEPRRVANLRNFGLNQEEVNRLKSEAEAYSAEMLKARDRMRLESEKIRNEYQRAMQELQQKMRDLNFETRGLEKKMIGQSI